MAEPPLAKGAPWDEMRPPPKAFPSETGPRAGGGGSVVERPAPTRGADKKATQYEDSAPSCEECHTRRARLVEGPTVYSNASYHVQPIARHSVCTDHALGTQHNLTQEQVRIPEQSGTVSGAAGRPRDGRGWQTAIPYWAPILEYLFAQISD